MSKIKMEVCIDSVISAINAEKGGASRVELCANLMEGGTTPSIGMVKMIKKTTSIPVFVMIRPRGGDFLYTDDEIEVMCEDIRELKAVGADGFVFGLLNQDGTVDCDSCRKLIDLAKPLPCTFHRAAVVVEWKTAIDMTRDIMEALETVISLGFCRVLTSGGDSTALEGLPVITRMVQTAGNRISIMPGGGITERNIQRIMTTCGASEFHASARSGRQSNMTFQKSGVSMGAALSPPEFSSKICDDAKVKQFIKLASDLG